MSAWATGLSNQKGGPYVVDDRCDIDSSLGTRAGQQLHDGRVHPYFACARTCSNRDQRHSGTESVTPIGIRTNYFTTKLQKGVSAMKKRNIVIHCLMLLMLVSTIAACAATRTHESTGEYVDDSVITTKVKALLAEDDFLKSFQIGVETYQGTVQLSGFVNSQQAVDKASEIVKGVKGVRSVKNSLIVK
jgi:osmotically-inducible protein OsmY